MAMVRYIISIIYGKKKRCGECDAASLFYIYRYVYRIIFLYGCLVAEYKYPCYCRAYIRVKCFPVARVDDCTVEVDNGNIAVCFVNIRIGD